jgi:uncharacterized protein YjiK
MKKLENRMPNTQILIKKTLYIWLVIFASCQPKNNTDLDFTESFPLKIKEPSGLAYHPQNRTLYIVSDHGYIAETDLQGKIIRKSKKIDKDLEAVCYHCQEIIVVSEKKRMFYKLNNQFQVTQKQRISYKGSKNKGFESLTYNEAKNCYVAISEKVPATLIELNDELEIIAKHKLKIKAKDISDATYFNGFIWLLSDENKMIFQCNPNDYQIHQSYHIKIDKPEGICFDKQGNLYICSDSAERLFVFEKAIPISDKNA